MKNNPSLRRQTAFFQRRWRVLLLLVFACGLSACASPVSLASTPAALSATSVPIPNIHPAQETYAIFVPSAIPEGLTKQPIMVGYAQRPGVNITYTTPQGEDALSVLNGPAGCCLDADPRKKGTVITLANGATAHFLAVEAAYGGPILWWIQDDTYIALSGPALTQRDLETIANSMVKAN
jgi:hypothetical protein